MNYHHLFHYVRTRSLMVYYILFALMTVSIVNVQHGYADQCKAGNLLYNLTPFTDNKTQLRSTGLQRSLRMTDGKKVVEGAFWSVEQAAIISKTGRITFDLKSKVSLKAFTIQADNNDEYEFWGSIDGGRFFRLWIAPKHSKPGLRTRAIQLKKPTLKVRYLQIRPKEGDSSYSIAEVQAFCSVPKNFPPKISQTRAIRKNNKDTRKHFIGKAKLGLAVFGILIFFVPRMLYARRRRSSLTEQNDETGKSNDDASATPKSLTLLNRLKNTWSKYEADLCDVLVYTATLASAVSTLWIAFTQVNRAVDHWADNGFLAQGLGHVLGLDATYHHWIFYNGSILMVIGFLLLIYAIVNLMKNRSIVHCVAEIQTIGFIGFIWVFATQCNEVMGKSNWLHIVLKKNDYRVPAGWEAIPIALVLTGILVYLYVSKRSELKANHVSDQAGEEAKDSELKSSESNDDGQTEHESDYTYTQALLKSTQKLGWSTVVILSIASFFSLGTFHGGRITHFWDSFHYYVGSKYFAENRYHLLYHCITLAEFDDGRGEKIKDRPLRSLVNNKVGLSGEVSNPDHPLVKECRAHFTPMRWEAFKQDIRLFRSYMGEAWWKKMFKDHGYNATPVWNMVGHTLTNWDWESKVPEAGLAYTPSNQKGQSSKARKTARDLFFNEARPRFEAEIIGLNLIDLSLYLILFALFIWAFGLEIAAFMLVFFGTGYPWSYDWTGGSVGRIPWLFTLGTSLCLLKKNYNLLAGFSLGWSLLLRVFPGSVLGGVAVHAILMIVKKIPWTSAHKRFILGGLLSFFILVPLSIPVGQGSVEKYQGVVQPYKEFLDNSLKHTSTPMTNNMGFPTLLSYHPGYTVRYAARKQKKLKEKLPAFGLWKQKHNEFKKSRRILLILCLLATFYFFYRIREKWELWEVISAGSIFAFFIFELTCYYYCFMIILTPLAFQRSREMLMLLCMVIASQIIQIYVGASDEEYLLESLAAAIPFFVFIIGRFLETLQGGDEQEKVLPAEVN